MTELKLGDVVKARSNIVLANYDGTTTSIEIGEVGIVVSDEVMGVDDFHGTEPFHYFLFGKSNIPFRVGSALVEKVGSNIWDILKRMWRNPYLPDEFDVKKWE